MERRKILARGSLPINVNVGGELARLMIRVYVETGVERDEATARTAKEQEKIRRLILSALQSPTPLNFAQIRAVLKKSGYDLQRAQLGLYLTALRQSGQVEYVIPHRYKLRAG